MRRFAIAASLAGLSLIASASPASSAVTIGQLAPSQPMTACPGVSVDRLQPTVTSGNSYVVPGNGTITSWSHNFAAGNQTMRMEIFRRVAGLRYMVVGHDGPRALTGGALNTFPASIQVRRGDVLGLHHSQPSMTTCPYFFAPGDQILSRNGNLADGEEGDFEVSPVDRRLNITAVFVPSNSFSFSDLDRNKKKGTAKLTVDIPNPGELDLSGKGLRKRNKSPDAAGDVVLKIKAKKNKLDRLEENGKVKVKPKVTFTPTGGDPSTQSRKLRLRKR
jgi:hypothetical protein